MLDVKTEIIKNPFQPIDGTDIPLWLDDCLVGISNTLSQGEGHKSKKSYLSTQSIIYCINSLNCFTAKGIAGHLSIGKTQSHRYFKALKLLTILVDTDPEIKAYIHKEKTMSIFNLFKSTKVVDDVFDKDKGLVTQVGNWIGGMNYTEEEKAEAVFRSQ